MDQEALISTKEEGKSNRSRSKTNIHLALATATFVLSLFALGLATAAYVRVHSDLSPNRSKATQVTGLDSESEKWVLNDIALRHFQRFASQGGRDQPANDVCNSTINRNSSILEKPSAHVVPSAVSGFRSTLQAVPVPTLSRDYYSIISNNWVCNRDSSSGLPFGVQLGHVHGGMLFNRTSGFLTLPLTGTYFIYSQVQFQITTDLSTVERVGYRTVACLPRPYGDCVAPGPLGFKYNYMESQQNDQYRAGSSAALFHGGVFHLPAGTQIGLMAYYSTSLRSSPGRGQGAGQLRFYGGWYESYFGAFLVDEIPLKF